MTTTVTAPGKLLLFGEYVVLEGAPALVMAVNRRITVRAIPHSTFTLTAPTLNVEALPLASLKGGALQFTADAMRDSRLVLVRAVLQWAAEHAREQGVLLPPVALDIDTEAFLLKKRGDKLGLGSSAALAVAVLVAILNEANVLPFIGSPERSSHRQMLLTWARKAHAMAQSGLGSGVDVAASVWGGILRFQLAQRGTPVPDDIRPPQINALRPLAQITLLAIWAGAPASTKAYLQAVLACKQQTPQKYWEIFEKLAVYAHAAVEFWALGNVDALLTIVDAYYEGLKTLGDICDVSIVTAPHQAIYREVRAAGGYYKPSGAGGGDLGIAFCATPQIAARVVAQVNSRGFQVIPLNIDASGLTMVKNAEH